MHWINATAQTNVQSIEELGTGNAYCKLFLKHFPGVINSTRVREKPQHEWEYLQNFKLL
jgi:hypothetical protein